MDARRPDHTRIANLLVAVHEFQKSLQGEPVTCAGVMSAGEVITLQFGGFANFVGAHYWNIQVTLPPGSCCKAVYSLTKNNSLLTDAGCIDAQDELAGLAEREEFSGVADQVDSNVLFRQGEDARVRCK